MFRIFFANVMFGLMGLYLLSPASIAGHLAHRETVLYAFTSGNDGSGPFGTIVRDRTGDLFGTTAFGGGFGCGGNGCGTVFRLGSDGTEKILYSFVDGTDGASPSSGLIVDRKGNLYGTALLGGSHGQGSVFEISPSGQEHTLYSFCGKSNCSDGQNPAGGVLMAAHGSLYGTAESGGNFNGICSSYNGCGVVFRLSKKLAETVVYTFQGGNDGFGPMTGVVADAAGNLYGTTSKGGGNGCNYSAGCGTVFKINPDNSETQIYAFTGGADGAYPLSGISRDGAGNLYGTTSAGGAYGHGTVFKIDVNGVETVLYNFCPQGYPCSDGDTPGSPILDKLGNIYGTTLFGGGGSCGAGCGVVFKLAPQGTETVLHLFTGQNGDGSEPLSTLLLDAKGNIYGTTAYGGLGLGGSESGYGTVFKLKK